MSQEKMTVAVLGLGRFGAFWAQLLSDRFNVIAWSRNPDRPVPPGVRRVEFEALFEAKALFLCNAISSMEKVAQTIAPHLKPGTVVLDTCSVKLHPLDALEKALPENVEIVGTHPMIGPDSAREGVEGMPVVVSPLRQQPDTLRFWIDSFQSLGLKVLEMSAEEHDREAAYTQGVTHFVGRMLNEMALDSSEMATSGYNSLQNIIKQTCNDSWQLFEDLQRYNPYTGLMRKDLHQALEVMLKRFDSIENPGFSGEESGHEG